MNLEEEIQRISQFYLWRSSSSKIVGQAIGLVVLYLVIIFMAPLIANFSPFFAVFMSWLWFILPGLILSFVLFRGSSWLERIPIAFVVSVGLTTPLTILAISLRLELNDYLVLVFGALFLVVITFCIYELRTNQTHAKSKTDYSLVESYKSDPFLIIMSVIVILMTVFLAYLASQWPTVGDDLSALPIFSEVLRLDRVTGTEPFHGSGTPSTPRNELIVWIYTNILTNKVSGTEPIEFFAGSRPILIVIATLALFTFLLRFINDRRLALFLLAIWNVYLLATLNSEGTGNDLITRIFQDKFSGWFIIVPIVLVFMLWFLEKSEWRYLVGFALVALGASVVHPITLTQVIILSGGFGLIHLIVERDRKTLFNLILVACVLLICIVLPIIQYFRYMNYMPIELAGLGDAVEFGRLSQAVRRYRLWLLYDGQYVLHPFVIWRPLLAAAYLLLPIIFFKVRKNYAARVLIGSMFILPALLYIPPLVGIVSRFVTPYLLWRLAWPLPLFAILTIGWVLWILVQKGGEWIGKSKGNSLIRNTILLGVLVLAMIIALPSIKAGFVDYTERRAEVTLSICATASDALAYLDELSKSNPVNVLASNRLNFCIPGYAALANVVEFRGYGTVNRLSAAKVQESVQRVEDVAYFNSVKQMDDLVLAAIRRHDIDYVLLEKDRIELDLQFKYLPSLFKQVYEDEDYRLYAVINPLSTSEIVEGNAALRRRQFDDAMEIFDEVLREDPENILAHIGVGLAHEGNGDSGRAIKAYQEGVKYASHEPAVHAQVGSAYLLVKDLESAIQEYLTATNLAPNRDVLYAELGRLYALTGQKGKADGSFERVASLRALKDTAAYYSILGQLYRASNLNSEAIKNYEKAIAIDPDPKNYVYLARSLSVSGEIEEAIDIYKQAITMDRWYYLPHLDLGYLYNTVGYYDAAIEEYEIASELNPTNVTTFILLGQAIQERAGLDEAIKHLESFTKLNKVLPGPRRGLATLFVVSGESESALEEFDFSNKVQPRNASIQTAIGYLLMEDGQLAAAEEAFDQALLSNPSLTSARLGLSLLYTKKAEFGRETGQYLNIVRKSPSTAWSHLKLADAYQRQGNWEAARQEIEWALELEPGNVDGYIAMGNLNRSRTRLNEAIIDYSQVLELEPENAEALTQLGDIYQSFADYSEAEKFYLEATQSNEKTVYPYLRLAEMYWQLGRYEEALDMQEAALEIAPDSDLALASVANTYRIQGRREEAKALYERVIQTDPSMLMAYTALAQLEAEEDYDQSVISTYFEKAVSANPGSSLAYLDAGKFLMDQGQLGRAEEVLLTSLTLPNVSPENYQTLSHLYQQLGSWELAQSTLEDSVKIFPGEAIAYQNLAEYSMQRGNYGEAEQWYEKAKAVDPSFIAAYIGLSNLSKNQGDAEKAQTILEDGIAANPGSAEMELALASFYEGRGDTARAEQSYLRAIDLAPAKVKYYQGIGKFYQRQNRFSEALDAFQQALSIPGAGVANYLDIGNVYWDLHQLEEAEGWYRAAIPVDRSDPKPYLALAGLYQWNEDWDNAVETLNTAIQIEPNHVEAYIALGKIVQQFARKDEARMYFERAYSLDKSRTDALKALGELYLSEGNWEASIDYFQRAVETSPVDNTLYALLGRAYQASGEPLTAQAVLKRGIRESLDKQAAFLAEATFFDEEGKWEQAKVDYETAWRLNPNSAVAGFQLVDLLRRRGDFEDALKILFEMGKINSDKAEIQVEIGNIYAIQGWWQQAKNAYERAIELNDHTKEAYLGLAHIYESQGKKNELMDVYQSAILASLNSAEIYLKLGDISMKELKYDQARDAYQRALNIDRWNTLARLKLDYLNNLLGEPEIDLSPLIERANMTPSVENYLTLAYLHEQRGEWGIARDWILRAIQFGPYHSGVWLALGDNYRVLGQMAKALDAYQTALIYAPASPVVLLALGTVLEEQGQFEQARVAYQQAIAADRSQIESYVALAELDSKSGDSDSALVTIREGMASNPGDPLGYQVLAAIYAGMEETDRARDALQAGMEQIPGAASLYARLGDLYSGWVFEVKSDLDVAESIAERASYRIEYLEDQRATASNRRQRRAIAVKFEVALEANRVAQRKLAFAQRVFKDSDVNLAIARELYQQALTLQPNHEAALIGLGNLSIASGSREEALGYYQKAAAAHPASALSLGLLANTYLGADRTEEAIRVFEEILVHDPTNIFAHYGLTRAYQESDHYDHQLAARVAAHAQYNWDHLIGYLRSIDG